jgi:hypothetical protein
LSAGLKITSTSGNWTSTFVVLTDSSGSSVWSMVLAEQAALGASGSTTFADGNTIIQWPDASGVLRVMTPTQFLSFAKAVGAFVAGCRNFSNGVPGATLPTATATIA